MEASSFPVGVKIPKGATLEKIESSYGPLDIAVHCGLADCGTPHKKGFVVVFRKAGSVTFERGLMGHICGKREFKEDWTQALARHHAEVRAIEVRAALEGFLETAKEVEPKLLALLPGLKARKAVRDTLLIDAREFMRICGDACRSQQGKLKGNWNEGVTHKLDGQLFFLQDNALDKANLILAGIRQMRVIGEKPNVKIKELSERLARLSNMRQAVSEIEKEAISGAAALRPAHMAKAIRVINDGYREGYLRITGTVLEVLPVWRIREVLRRLPEESDWVAVADLSQVLDTG